MEGSRNNDENTGEGDGGAVYETSFDDGSSFSNDLLPTAVAHAATTAAAATSTTALLMSSTFLNTTASSSEGDDEEDSEHGGGGGGPDPLPFLSMSKTQVLRKNLETAAFQSVQSAGHHRQSSSVSNKKNPLFPVDSVETAPVGAASSGRNAPPCLVSNMVPSVPSSSVSSHATLSSGLSVFLRIRPSTDSSEDTIRVLSDTTVQTHPPPLSFANRLAQASTSTGASLSSSSSLIREFDFSRVLPSTTSQQDVYQHTTAPLIQGLVVHQSRSNHNPAAAGNSSTATLGHSALIFCYGMTNAGKTHTITGTIRENGPSDGAQWGILPRALLDLLTRVQPHPHLQLHMSYMEIYKEQIYDLLAEPSNATSFHDVPPTLTIGKRQGQAVVLGLTHHPLDSLNHALHLIQQAKRRRHTATNNLNQASSRSHCICQITLTDQTSACVEESGEQETTDATPSCVNLWIVDLAGSERSKRTGVGAERQKEASLINMSLMTLMRCLMALRSSQQQQPANAASTTTTTLPPYRDSKLTHLFMNHFTGPAAGRTTMIVNVNPAASDFDETQHVLAYASKARAVQIIPQKFTTEAMGTTSTTTVVEYDQNGRRCLRQKVGSFLKKLSPRRPKRKVETTKVGGHVDETSAAVHHHKRVKVAEIKLKDAGHRKPIRNKVAGTTSSTDLAPVGAGLSNSTTASACEMNKDASKIIKRLETSLSVAKTENEMLRNEIEELKGQLETQESEIREEVGQEMEAQMNALEERYGQTIAQLKRQMAPSAMEAVEVNATASAVKVKSSMPLGSMMGWSCKKVLSLERVQAERDRLQAQLDRAQMAWKLAQEEYAQQMSVKESEIDLFRQINRDLQARVAQLEQESRQQSKHATERQEKDSGDIGEDDGHKKIRTLEEQLAQSKAEISKLQRSKQELIDNYEKLLHDGDEEDDEEEEEEEEEEERHESDDEDHFNIEQEEEEKVEVIAHDDIVDDINAKQEENDSIKDTGIEIDDANAECSRMNINEFMEVDDDVDDEEDDGEDEKTRRNTIIAGSRLQLTLENTERHCDEKILEEDGDNDDDEGEEEDRRTTQLRVRPSLESKADEMKMQEEKCVESNAEAMKPECESHANVHGNNHGVGAVIFVSEADKICSSQNKSLLWEGNGRAKEVTAVEATETEYIASVCTGDGKGTSKANQNEHSSVKTSRSKRNTRRKSISASSIDHKPPASKSKRPPLSVMSENTFPSISESPLNDDCEDDDVAKWLYPKKAIKQDPETGMYRKPSGRKPKDADTWDARKGAWRLSIV